MALDHENGATEWARITAWLDAPPPPRALSAVADPTVHDPGEAAAFAAFEAAGGV